MPRRSSARAGIRRGFFGTYSPSAGSTCLTASPSAPSSSASTSVPPSPSPSAPRGTLTVTPPPGVTVVYDVRAPCNPNSHPASGLPSPTRNGPPSPYLVGISVPVFTWAQLHAVQNCIQIVQAKHTHGHSVHSSTADLSCTYNRWS